MADDRKKLRREQLLGKYEKHGYNSLTEQERLELLLTYSNSGDVSSLASILLSEYGSVNALSRADPQLLMKGGTVNEQTAVLLRLIPAVSRVLYTERFTVSTINSAEAAKSFFSGRFLGAVGEQLMITSVSKRFRAVNTKILAFGSASAVSSTYRDISDFTVKTDCTVFFIAHNHPDGAAKPSDSDMLLTLNVMKALSVLDAVLADHFIVGKDEAFSMRESGLLPEMRADGVKGYKCGK